MRHEGEVAPANHSHLPTQFPSLSPKATALYRRDMLDIAQFYPPNPLLYVFRLLSREQDRGDWVLEMHIDGGVVVVDIAPEIPSAQELSERFECPVFIEGLNI